jgi:hypothetical protein
LQRPQVERRHLKPPAILKTKLEKGPLKRLYRKLPASSLTQFFERPLVNIDGEIVSVVSIIHQSAAAKIPSSGQKSQVKNFIHDQELKQVSSKQISLENLA